MVFHDLNNRKNHNQKAQPNPKTTQREKGKKSTKVGVEVGISNVAVVYQSYNETIKL